MKIERLAIPEVCLITPQVYADARGFFTEAYHAARYAEAGIPADFVQDNRSRSQRQVLRGLHYQLEHPQGKLVSVLEGEIFDVAVDIRRSSPSFGQWVGVTMRAEDFHQLWIPSGFAHGFYVLSEFAEVLYKVTAYYAPGSDRSLLWNDPEIGIQWPLLDGRPPRLSEKDAAAPPLREAEVYE